MNINDYIKTIYQLHQSGKATEHSYRPALQNMLAALLLDTQVTNEPKRQRCGAPDYILTRRGIDIGYIEAKDIGISLDKTEKDEQLKRYLDSLDNLILTDYMEFRFYLRGSKTETVAIAKPMPNGTIQALPENFARFESLIRDFGAFQGQTIKTAKMLAQMMARKARLMRDVFFLAVSDTTVEPNGLRDQLAGFQQILVHDMDEAQFADVYAQTIAYGLFTARLHDTTLDTFSRAEARDLIPKSNPFLRQMFDYIAGSELDTRVHWIVDALCEVYRYADLPAILKDFGKATGQNDPILHFYETFLAEYDPKLRKSRGVWYTPEPVVNFIVRAVDEVLKTHFGLKDGLADTSKIKIDVEVAAKGAKGKPVKVTQDVHKVQILDVATGTGTFLAEIIKQIYRRFEGQEGLWSHYVEQDLLPRLHGFELLMASYAMCHMKLDMLLQETGYKPSKPDQPPRVGVYLTNSLEEYHPETGTLFAGWLSREANEANRIKKDMPIMVAIGNPPYSVSSSNKGLWIESLTKDYKKGLNENNINSLSDDYVKFIRMSEHYIEKNGSGIVAMITNNSFIDGVIHRQMRKHLLETFDHIYIYDLHGSATKQETAPDGSKDENVFDIRQGVCIFIMIKKETEKKHESSYADVYHLDSHGRRQDKYNILFKAGLKDTEFKKINAVAPEYFFVPYDTSSLDVYKQGFLITDLFLQKNLGTKFRKDNLLVKPHFTIESVQEMIHDMNEIDDVSLLKKYDFLETKDWNIKEQRENFVIGDDHSIQKVIYRTFDYRYTYYPIERINKIIPRGDSRKGLMKNIANRENVSLLFLRNNRLSTQDGFFVSNCIVNKDAVSSLDNCYCAPLYIYDSLMDGKEEKTPNFSPKVYAKIKEHIPAATPEQIFDYIYAVLHSPTYRSRYAEFLKSDFPRIPYPTDRATFDALAEKGEALCALHLMESPLLDKPITRYPIAGDHMVDRPHWEHATETNGDTGRVWLNATQYFDNVPLIAWQFYIGGYQPAQKWLKDRRGRVLTMDDIRHWQRIIVALTETDKVMKEIDQISFLPGS